MNSANFTAFDCQREAWLETQAILAQRKIDRLFKIIAFKEVIAQGLLSPWFCAHYDQQIGRRYALMAELEGGVRAAKLELERLADRRHADQARRMAALMQVAPPAVKSGAPPTPSSDPRHKQQAMFFGPGEPPAAPSTSPSVMIDQRAENDIAAALELCQREIPPPDPIPTSTPTATASTTDAAPLTRPTLSRLVSTGSAGQVEMPAGDAAPADEGEEESTSAEGPATAMTAPASADAKESVDGPTKPAGSTSGERSEREQPEPDGSRGMN